MKLALGTAAHFENIPDNAFDIDSDTEEEPSSLAEFSEPALSLDHDGHSLGDTVEPTSLAEFAAETSPRPARHSIQQRRHRHLQSVRQKPGGSRAWRQRHRHIRRLGPHRQAQRLQREQKSRRGRHTSIIARRGDTELSLLVKQKMLEKGTDWTLIFMSVVVVAALCGLAYFFYQDRMVDPSSKQEGTTKATEDNTVTEEVVEQETY